MGKQQQLRSEERRQTILSAALNRFRSEGFHGAGISAICKEAGISPGHLYHYFESKEAIIDAIVQEDRARAMSIFAHIRSQPEPIATLLELAMAGLRNDLGFFGFAMDPVLSSEIFAEAARNPRIASLLVNFDREARSQLATILSEAQGRGEVSGAVDVESAARLMLVLVDGVMNRSISDPSMKVEKLEPGLRRMLLACLGE